MAFVAYVDDGGDTSEPPAEPVATSPEIAIDASGVPDDAGTPAESAPAERPASAVAAELAARPLPRIIAIANQKGGVGKTTTAVNLGAALAELGYRVLVVDLDPQGNATTGLGVNGRNLQSSIYDVIMNDAP